MENKKDNRGGARLGAGRPKGTFKGNNVRKRSLSFNIKITEEELEKINEVLEHLKQSKLLNKTDGLLYVFDSFKNDYIK